MNPESSFWTPIVVSANSYAVAFIGEFLSIIRFISKSGGKTKTHQTNDQADHPSHPSRVLCHTLLFQFLCK